MASRGEKRQLRQLVKNLHEMLRSLGEQDGQKMVIEIDQFEYLKQHFTKAATTYQNANTQLPLTSDQKRRGILIYEMSDARNAMDQCLRKMATLVTHIKNKKQKKQSVAAKTTKKKQEFQKLENQLQYKCLTLYHLQQIYFQSTKKQHHSASKPEYYPDAATIQQLKLRKPLNRGFDEESDHNASEYLEEQQILEVIKQIDSRIEEKMDYILEGIKMMNYNAICISEGIDNIQKKILINVENLQENLDQLEEAHNLLDEASPHASKPNCIMNVIIAVLLAIIAFLIIRKLMDVNQVDPNVIN